MIQYVIQWLDAKKHVVAEDTHTCIEIGVALESAIRELKRGVAFHSDATDYRVLTTNPEAQQSFQSVIAFHQREGAI